MTMLQNAPDTATADQWVRSGFADKGDLILSGSGKLYRVERCMKGGVNYAATCEEGKSWKIRVAQAKAAPVGAVWSGPETSPRDERQEARAAIAGEFKVGDVVEFTRAKDKVDAPGKFLVVKRTSATRLKLVGIGSGLEFTAPATIIAKVAFDQVTPDEATDRVWLVLETLAVANPEMTLKEGVILGQKIYAEVDWLQREGITSRPPHQLPPADWTPQVLGAWAGMQADVLVYLPDKRINAIKELCGLTGAGLKEAKEAVDWLVDHRASRGLT